MMDDRSSSMRPSGRAWFRLLALAALALVLPVHSARAGLLVEFAQFTKAPADSFVFTPGNTSTTLQTASKGAPIEFEFLTSALLPALPPSLTGPQAAHLFLDLSTSDSASGTALFFNQPFTSDPGTLRIVRDADQRTLLAIDFTGSLLGMNSAGYLSGQSGAPGIVRFSSDFLNFDATTLQFLGVMLTNPSALTVGGTLLNGFQAGGMGSFSVDGPLVVAPEPSTLITGGLGAVALALVVRRQRRRRRAAA